VIAMPSHFALETTELVRRFGARLALDHVTLEIPHGGIHALVGRNGAGKSTLFRVLLGFLSASGGTGRLLGFDSADLSPATRGRIGWVSESHSLPDWMRVAELTAMQRALYPRWSEATFGEVASLFRFPADRPVRHLSRGERAGLALALVLAPEPELLLLDEPTQGLDVVASRAFLEALLFAGEREIGTIVYSSHRMAEVERVADRVIVLDRGRVIASESPDDLRARVSAWAVEEWPAERPVEAIPGLLDSRRIDGGLHLYVLDPPESLPADLGAWGARGITPLPLSFERALDAFLQGGGRGGEGKVA
jgi:ABC-2 type transport system ATP-binding protein